MWPSLMILSYIGIEARQSEIISKLYVDNRRISCDLFVCSTTVNLTIPSLDFEKFPVMYSSSVRPFWEL